MNRQDLPEEYLARRPIQQNHTDHSNVALTAHRITIFDATKGLPGAHRIAH
jgi:hypothetical protein